MCSIESRIGNTGLAHKGYFLSFISFFLACKSNYCDSVPNFRKELSEVKDKSFTCKKDLSFDNYYISTKTLLQSGC